MAISDQIRPDPSVVSDVVQRMENGYTFEVSGNFLVGEARGCTVAIGCGTDAAAAALFAAAARTHADALDARAGALRVAHGL